MKEIFIWASGIFAALLAIFFYGKVSGKKEEQAKQNSEALNDIEKDKKRVNAVNSSSVSERAKRMLDRNLQE